MITFEGSTMGLVDLHVHSNASDGTFSSSEVVRLAARIGPDIIALIDHGITAGIAEVFRAGVQYDAKVVPGIEVSNSHRGCGVHVPEFFVHPEDPTLEHILEQFRERRDERNKGMPRRFAADGIILASGKLCASNPNMVITRAHVAGVLLARGFAPSIDQVSKKYLQCDGQYCPPKAYLSSGEVMGVLLSGGTFVVLAHPFRYRLGDKGTQELTAFLAGMGMKGLEVYHSPHSRLESTRLQAMASAYGLFSTGGPDSHGSDKPGIFIDWGRGGLKVSPLLLDDIKKACRS